MAALQENRSAYASQTQRLVLMELAESEALAEGFFLTGGTALAVFYLGHRASEGIDLFTLGPADMRDIDFWIMSRFAGEARRIRQSPTFLSYVIKQVKVDLAEDRFSIKADRRFDNGLTIYVDVAENIVTNKLCTLISRTEPKDYIDFYCLVKGRPASDIARIYEDAMEKDAFLEDSPAAAYIMEEGFKKALENRDRWPRLLTELDIEDFKEFYRNTVGVVYNIKRPKTV